VINSVSGTRTPPPDGGNRYHREYAIRHHSMIDFEVFPTTAVISRPTTIESILR